MRSRRPSHTQVAEVARRRLELLSAELAEIRPDHPDRPGPWPPDGSGELDGPYLPPAEHDRPGGSVVHPPADAATEPGRHARRGVGVAGSVAGWAHDRLPPSLQGRVGLAPVHLTVVALVVALAVAATAWWVLRARGDDLAVVAPGPGPALVTPAAPSGGGPSSVPGVADGEASGGTVPGASGGVAGSAAGTAAAPGGPGAAGSPAGGTSAAGGAVATGSIVVDVTGKVRRPGIATLPAGSRVVDALEAAGGARRGARLGSLNLARVLTDGEQVVVGVPAVPGVAGPAASAAAGTAGGSGAATSTPMVDINTADQATLEELPGVGPVTARAILAFRTENGAFTSVDELLEVSGIGDATLAEMAPFVTL